MPPKSDARNLEYTLLIIAFFTAYVIYNDDPSGFGSFFVGGIAYVSCLVLTFAGFVYARKEERFAYVILMVVGTAAVLVSAYLITNGNGSPTQGNLISTSCTNIKIPNATSPTGFVYGSKCTSSPYYADASILYNLAFWSPLVGATIYAVPVWIDRANRSFVTSFSRNLKGSVPAGALLFLTFGLFNPSRGYPELFNGHSPLNPFVAYNYCDSTTFGVVRCVQTNALFYFIDYLFWIAVVSLIVLTVSELLSFRASSQSKNQESPTTSERVSTTTLEDQSS